MAGHKEKLVYRTFDPKDAAVNAQGIVHNSSKHTASMVATSTTEACEDGITHAQL